MVKPKKTIWARWHMIVFYVFVGLIFIGILLPNSNNSQTNTNSQLNGEQKLLTMEQQMEQSLIKFLRSSNRNVGRLVNFKYIDTTNLDRGSRS